MGQGTFWFVSFAHCSIDGSKCLATYCLSLPKNNKIRLDWRSGRDRKELNKDWQVVGMGWELSMRDKFVLSASYGDWDMDKSWPIYYETQPSTRGIGRQRVYSTAVLHSMPEFYGKGLKHRLACHLLMQKHFVVVPVNGE